MAAISMSDDLNSKTNFGPFLNGIELVPFNDFNALKNLFEKEDIVLIQGAGNISQVIKLL